MAFVSVYQSVALVAISLFGYCVCLAVYRLYLHPLAKFPGPKIAALTGWYETYYEIALTGQYYLKTEEMHRKYGPIVRYLPNELHIQDLAFLDEMFPSTNRKRNKPPSSQWQGQSNAPFFFTLDHDLHRKRRAVVNPLFSKRAVTDLSGVVHEMVDKIMRRLEAASGTPEVLRLDAAFTALTTDVITQYSFDKSWGCLDQHDFNLAWKNVMIESFSTSPVSRQFPIIPASLEAIPVWLLKLLIPGMAVFLDWRTEVESHVKTILEPSSPSSGEKDLKEDSSTAFTTSKTVFHSIKDSNLPASEKSLKRLTEEGVILVGGGAETTGRALMVGAYHLIKHPDVLAQLRSELATLPSKPSLPALENSPYLSAVVHESIRLGGSAAQPIARIAPSETLTYHDKTRNKTYTIPPNTAFSATATMLCYDPVLFPDPHAFKPERWLENASRSPQGDPRAKVLFGTGARHCVGMNLAYAELYVAISEIFRRFELELFETGEKDWVIRHWCVVPLVKLDSKGLRVKVKGTVE